MFKVPLSLWQVNLTQPCFLLIHGAIERITAGKALSTVPDIASLQ